MGTSWFSIFIMEKWNKTHFIAIFELENFLDFHPVFHGAKIWLKRLTFEHLDDDQKYISTLGTKYKLKSLISFNNFS